MILLVSNLRGHNTGRGGHLYTVADYFRAVSTRRSVELVCIGHEIPPPLRILEPTLVRVESMRDVFSAARSLRRMLADDVVLHAFDATAVLVARLARKSPIVFTKCGGAVTRRYTPSVHPDVVFHDEDFAYYSGKGAPLDHRFLRLIPNRVFPSQQHVVSRDAFPACACLVMRVSRICKKYEESILQGVRLTKFLADNGIDAKFVCIGYPEDKLVLTRIESALDGVGELVVDENMTTNGSRHLVHADVVIASGRGAMESALLGRVTFVPEKYRHLPALLDSRTINEGIYHNFSDRCRFSGRADDADVLRILVESGARDEYLQSLKMISDDYFDLRPRLDEYMAIYENAALAKSMSSWFDIAKHMANFFFFGAIRLIRRRRE